MDTATAGTEGQGSLRDEMARVKADLRRVVDDLADLRSAAACAASEGVSEVKGRVAEAAHSAVAKGRESVERVEKAVSDHPLISLAAAFGIGLAVGVGVSRKG